MAIFDRLKSLTVKKNEMVNKEVPDNTALASDAFPIVRASDMQTDKYKSIPLSGIALIGSAFAKLPDSARTMVTTVTKAIDLKETLFVGVNEKGISGYLNMTRNGTVGNIMQINEQGKHVIAGRLKFRPLNQLPMTETTTTVLPIDPMTMAIAAALYTINNKLDTLQKKAEEILQFLTLEKQSRQRGNLNMLSDVMDEYKRECENEKLCSLRVIAVQDIKREAYQDMVFYQEQIGNRLGEQKKLHVIKNVRDYLDSVFSEFREYQLACYLFGYASFAEIMLQKNFDERHIASVSAKISEFASRYHTLYTECRTQIAEYRRSSIEAKLIGGLGNVAKAAGEKLASVPIISKGSVDEALKNAGESLVGHNRSAITDLIEQFTPMEDCRLIPFVEDLTTLNMIHNRTNGLLTDGENLYMRIAE